MGPLSPHIAGHIALHGSRLIHGQEDQWKTTRRSYGRFDCAFGSLGMFMNTTLRAAVHLGNDHDTNLRFVQKCLWKTTGQLFKETEKLISGQTETTGISLIDSKDFRWISTSLLHNRAHQYATAKVYVFSDSVLCLGRMGDDPVGSWKNKIQWYSDTNYFSELNRIDGQPMEFEWKIFPGF